jgi:cationic amino acid transporter 4
MALAKEKALYKASFRHCGCRRFIEKTQRTKTLPADIMQTSLKRCLNSFDLTLFGIGHMIGGGIYVLTGTVAKKVAGPGVIFSYIIAGIVSILVALCYAEFGSKIPKTGSAYMYTYVILGECWAYLVAWDLILEQAIGAAAVARAWSGAVNVLSGGAVENGTIAVFGTINSPLASPYPDMLSVALLIVLTIIVVTGVRFSSIVNNILTVTNLFFLAFTIIAAFVFAQPANWVNSDNGGPLPFGFGGVIAGSATVFFSYVGFECVTQAAEEATRPERSVPIGTMGAMAIVTLLYVLAALSLTMLAPYATIDITVPFAKAFAHRGVNWMQYITAVGTLVATTTTTMASLYSLSRLVYALAQDRALLHVLRLRQLENAYPYYRHYCVQHHCDDHGSCY